MSPDAKLLILANMNIKLFIWTFTFRQVVWQRIWGEVLVLIQVIGKKQVAWFF